MIRTVSLAGAVLLLCLTASVITKADPVFPVFHSDHLLEGLANPHFGSKLLLEAGLSHDAGLHLGWNKNKNFSAITPSVDEDCRWDSSPVTGPATANPEPATMILLGTGLLGIGGMVRKKRKNRKSQSHNSPGS